MKENYRIMNSQIVKNTKKEKVIVELLQYKDKYKISRVIILENQVINKEWCFREFTKALSLWTMLCNQNYK